MTASSMFTATLQPRPVRSRFKKGGHGPRDREEARGQVGRMQGHSNGPAARLSAKAVGSAQPHGYVIEGRMVPVRARRAEAGNRAGDDAGVEAL